MRINKNLNITFDDQGGGIGGLLAMKENGSTYYYLYDGKGNVTAFTDSSGTVVATYTYNPFGVLTEKTGTLDQPFRFSTKRYDEETGLSYYGYRFYSASLGRWITRDPLGEAEGMNLYGFVGNDSINGVDPLGLFGIAAPIPSKERFAEMLLSDSLPEWAVDLLYSIYTDPSIDAGIGCACKTSARGAGAIIERHHLLPIQFKKKFAAVGLDIEDYILSMSRGAHRLKAYDGLHTGKINWNLQWKIFFETKIY